MTADLRSNLRSYLRKSLRMARRALTPRQQRLASVRLFRISIRQFPLRTARHIAFYFPIDGEIDPGPLLQVALKHGKHCFLPIINPVKRDSLLFMRYTSGTRLRRNRWGIDEPRLQSGKRRAPWTLDVIFVPLTGFDSAGNRLGMGKGFYDRAFQFKQKSLRTRPLLIGLAHDFQKQDALPREDWDVRLDGVISDRSVYRLSTTGF